MVGGMSDVLHDIYVELFYPEYSKMLREIDILYESLKRRISRADEVRLWM